MTSPSLRSRFLDHTSRLLDQVFDGPELSLLIEIAKKAAVFVSLLAISEYLGLQLEQLKASHSPSLHYWTLWVLDQLIFYGDAVWFAISLITEFWKSGRQLLTGLARGGSDVSGR